MDIRVLIDDFYEFHGKYIKSSPNLKLFAIKTYIFAKKQHLHDKKYGIGPIPSTHPRTCLPRRVPTARKERCQYLKLLNY